MNIKKSTVDWLFRRLEEFESELDSAIDSVNCSLKKLFVEFKKEHPQIGDSYHSGFESACLIKGVWEISNDTNSETIYYNNRRYAGGGDYDSPVGFTLSAEILFDRMSFEVKQKDAALKWLNKQITARKAAEKKIIDDKEKRRLEYLKLQREFGSEVNQQPAGQDTTSPSPSSPTQQS